MLVLILFRKENFYSSVIFWTKEVEDILICGFGFDETLLFWDLVGLYIGFYVIDSLLTRF